MSEPLEPTGPVDPKDTDLNMLDFTFSVDAARAAAFRAGETDPLIVGLLNKLASNEIEVLPLGVKPESSEPAEPRIIDAAQTERLQNMLGRRLAKRFAEQRRLIKLVDDQNPDNWLS